MRALWITAVLLIITCLCTSLTHRQFRILEENRNSQADSLRYLYSRTPDRWPRPTLDSGIAHIELGIIPGSPLDPQRGELQSLIDLGQVLFFDPRLSVSNQISCSSCHAPDMHWTDGRKLSVGHDHQRNTRNAPTVENTWFYDRFFWDGRSSSLEEQAREPIINPIEMHQDMRKLPKKLARIKGYRPLFKAAFTDEKITEERILSALAVFQRSIASGVTDFDYFLAGLSTRLTDQQIEGFHLFRTKARCMNCHNGSLFTDGQFHNLGRSNYGTAEEDLGLYKTTKDAADVGKFRTPGLRNVMNTGPWFHNGVFNDMTVLTAQYIMGLGQPAPTEAQKNDPLFPVLSPHIKALPLNAKERDALIAFMQSLSSAPVMIEPPVLPK